MIKMFRRTYRYSVFTKAAHHATDWIGSVQSLVVHTILFVVSFALPFFGVPVGQVLLVVTTIVSLEAIYLAIFIQMAINQNSQSLDAIEEDIDEIQEDIDKIEEGETEEQARDRQHRVMLEKMSANLSELGEEIEKMKGNLL